MPDGNTSIQGIEFEIKGSADVAAKSIGKMAAALSNFKKVVANGGLNLSGVAKDFKSFSKSVSGLKFGEVTQMASSLSKLGGSSKSLGYVADYLLGISQMNFSNVMGISDVLGDVANTIRSTQSFGKENGVGGAEKERPASGLKDFFSAARMTGDDAGKLAYGLDSVRVGLMAIGGGAVRAAATGIKGVGSAAFTAGKAVAEMGVKLIAAPFKDIANRAKNAATGIKQFVSSIGRIAMYRGIRTVMKEITQGIKEGVDNLYQYSRVVGTDFHRAMDSIATDAQYIKNSFATVAAPILEAIAPVFEAIAAKIADAMNLLAQFLAMLSGKSSYTKAVRGAKEYGDAVSGAAKEAKKFLLGIDELNIFDNSHGSGGAQTDYRSMFEESTVGSEMGDFAKRFKDAIDNGNWDVAGKLLGGKVNEVFSNIQWENIGAEVGSKISNIVTLIYNAMSTINFKRLGEQIASSLNGLLGSIKFEDVGGLYVKAKTFLWKTLFGAVLGLDREKFGNAIGGFLNGAVKEANRFLRGTNWKELGNKMASLAGTAINKVAQAIYDFNWAGLANAVGDFLKGAMDGAVEWLVSKDWSKIGNDTYTKLKTTLEKIDFAGIAKSVFNFLGTALGAGVSLLSGFISGVVSDIKDYFLRFIRDENGDGHFGAGEIISGIYEGIKNAIVGIGTWIKENIFDPFINGFKSAFGIHSPSTVMAEQGQYIIDGLLQGITDKLYGISSWIWVNVFKPVYDGFTSAFGVGAGQTNEMTTIGSSVVNGILSGMKSAWDNLVTWWSNLSLPEFKIKMPHISWTTTPATGWVSDILSALGLPTSLPKMNVQWYANGGFPEIGEMFIAREAGPELVGQIGNRTAVANNDQIVAAVSSGVASANRDVVAELRNMAARLERAIENIENDVYIDSQKVTQAQNRRVRARGAVQAYG